MWEIWDRCVRDEWETSDKRGERDEREVLGCNKTASSQYHKKVYQIL